MMTMGKRMTRTLLVAGLVAAAGLLPARGEDRVVFVDMDKVFNEFYRTKLADAQLKDEAEAYKTERAALIDAFKRLQDDFKTVRDESQDTALSEDARNQKRTAAEEKLVELREMDGKIRRFDETRRRRIEEQMKRQRDKLVGEIRETITSYAKGQGFTAVVDASGLSLNGVPSVLFYESKNDITQAVIDLLNTGKK